MTNPPPLTNTSLWPCKMCIKTVFGAGGGEGGRGGGEEINTTITLDKDR